MQFEPDLESAIEQVNRFASIMIIQMKRLITPL